MFPWSASQINFIPSSSIPLSQRLLQIISWKERMDESNNSLQPLRGCVVSKMSNDNLHRSRIQTTIFIWRILNITNSIQKTKIFYLTSEKGQESSRSNPFSSFVPSQEVFSGSFAS
jgi:hypothetical protein